MVLMPRIRCMSRSELQIHSLENYSFFTQPRRQERGQPWLNVVLSKISFGGSLCLNTARNNSKE